MSFFYRSVRIGKDGKPFELLKIRTLREGSSNGNSFVRQEQYTRFGRFLRMTKIDELPQLWNVFRGDMRMFGYRAEELRTWNVLPDSIRQTLVQEKPGIIDLASVHFIDEERLIQMSKDAHRTYFEDIRPIKFALQVFFIQNRSWLLNAAVVWMYVKKMVRSITRI